MALKETTGKKTYLTIRDGKIARKQGEEWTLYNSVEGKIVGLSTREGKYGTDLCIDLMDDELYQLQIKIKGGESAKQSSYFIAFAHCSPNLDLNQKVEFIPSLKIENDRKRAALFLKQGGEVIKWAFKKGDGMPDPEEVYNKKGELVSVDWSEVETFRMDKVNELVGKLGKPVEKDIVADFAHNVNVEDDDLPF